MSLPLSAQNNGDRLLGTYLAVLSHNDAKIRVIRHGDGYRMQVCWLKETHHPDGRLKTDSKNPDKSRRATPLDQVVLIDHVTYDNGVWRNGRIYDPTSGKSYKVELRFEDDKTLEVRGIVGPFHKSFHWTKIQ